MENFAESLGILEAAVLVCVLSGIPLAAALVVGLAVSVLQAATQIQEQTLGFLPRITVVGALLYFGGRWMVSLLEQYFTKVLNSLPELSRSLNLS